MKIYLVGGAVRDKIMGIQSQDRDWVVVGSSPEEMIARGFCSVGSSFPVFLDDQGEEYALARTEYKDGAGYKGFKVAFGEDVTLEEDLSRRDLTINAIAMSEDGNDIIDPFGGREDIANGILRHTSDAFSDDPLRVIRLARFYSRFTGSTVAPETIELSKVITGRSDFQTLSPERVGVELLKVLKHSPEPWKFFEFLKDVNGLEFYFPEIHALVDVPAGPIHYHPEGTAFIHEMLVLRQTVISGLSTEERFAALVHDLGKGLTPKDMLPHHYGHEGAGVKPTGSMVDRLSLGNDLKKIGQYVAKFHMHVHKAMILNPKTFVKVFEETPRDNPMLYVENLVSVSMCDARGRGPESEKEDYPQAGFFLAVMQGIDSIKVRNIMTEEQIATAKPTKIIETLYRARIAAAQQAITNLKA